MSQQELSMSDMVRFTETIMEHCRGEALHATEIVMGALNFLTENVPDQESQIAHEKLSSGSLKDYLESLDIQESDDASRQQMINSIVQQLQFQDYMSQQLHVLVQMMHCWLDARSTVAEAVDLSDQQLTDFGNALIAETVSETEKGIIRRYIPQASAAVEEPAEADDCLF
ncbi:MAG: hypothetical protein V3W04_06110 [Gammaproteobacteria bacterium]